MTTFTESASDRSFIKSERMLLNARRQAEERGFDQFPIVDIDSHHYEDSSWADIAKYVEHPRVKELMDSSLARRYGGGVTLTPRQIGNQEVGGRILRPGLRKMDPYTPEHYTGHKDAVISKWAMDMMGIDYTVLFPTPMLWLGLHPQVEVETSLAHAYARWLTEEVLPEEPRIKTMLYLPFNDPEASVNIVKEFSDRPGVVGFMVTSVRYRPVHHNEYADVYLELQERNKPLCFHAAYNWNERAMEQLNRFISVHALGFTMCNMIHLTNMVINGIPERYPDLKLVWVESGLAWVPFLMQRLDNEFLMRTSEAPLLKRRPSEYMREFYYSTQPMEVPDDLGVLEKTFQMVNAEERLLYSSDYPHWDFDLPGRIYDLPFLDEQAKRRILGQNAVDLFGIDLGDTTSFHGGVPDGRLAPDEVEAVPANE